MRPLGVKARTTGFDWVAHEKESEDAVRATTGDEEFARVMNRIVMLLDNGHTHIAAGGEVRAYAQMGEKPWKDQVAKTTPERADYWPNLSGAVYGTGPLSGTEPFVATYAAGDYVVVDVAPALSAPGTALTRRSWYIPPGTAEYTDGRAGRIVNIA